MHPALFDAGRLCAHPNNLVTSRLNCQYRQTFRLQVLNKARSGTCVLYENLCVRVFPRRLHDNAFEFGIGVLAADKVEQDVLIGKPAPNRSDGVV